MNFMGRKNQKYLKRQTYSILIYIFTDEGKIIRFCPFIEIIKLKREGKDRRLSISKHKKTRF